MRRARVLVLEHHRDLREALVEALLDEGYLVAPAPTAAAALLTLRGTCEGQPPDLVLLDAQDGQDVLTEVRSSQRYAGVALVTLSFPFDPPSDADADVRRPFRLEELLEAVRGALSRHPSPSPRAPLHPGA